MHSKTCLLHIIYILPLFELILKEDKVRTFPVNGYSDRGLGFGYYLLTIRALPTMSFTVKLPTLDFLFAVSETLSSASFVGLLKTFP